MKKIFVIGAMIIVAACNEKGIQTENNVDSNADAISDSLQNKTDSLGISGDSTKARD